MIKIIMEPTISSAFASQKNAPNKRLADIIARVEKKYGIDSAELDDEALGWVSAAGELNDDLDAVAGGACSDDSGNDNPAVGVGDTVQITSGKNCSSCGSNMGIAARLRKGAYIKCAQCGDAICKFNECTYIVIG